METKYDVFISYSRKDYVDENENVRSGNIISRICDELDKASVSYFFDKQGVYSGDEFAPILARAIKDCEIFLFVSTENSNTSIWTVRELATAQAYKKKIIPFKVDDSLYNDSVIIYLAHLDYIDYKSNPDKAFLRLNESVSFYLYKLREERKIQEEEERRRLKTYVEEQKKMVAEIELDISKLDNDESKILLDRKRISLMIQNVEDQTQRQNLSDVLKKTGKIRSHYEKVQTELEDEIFQLKKKLEELENKETDSQNKGELQNELEMSNKRIDNYMARCNVLIEECETLQTKCQKLSNIIYSLEADRNSLRKQKLVILIPFVIIIAFLLICVMLGEITIFGRHIIG